VCVCAADGFNAFVLSLKAHCGCCSGTCAPEKGHPGRDGQLDGCCADIVVAAAAFTVVLFHDGSPYC